MPKVKEPTQKNRLLRAAFFPAARCEIYVKMNPLDFFSRGAGMNKKSGGMILLAFFLLSGGGRPSASFGQDQAAKPKIFRNTYPLVTETDLYCTPFLLEKEPSLRILEPAAGERLLLSDADQFWAGPGNGIREGQLLQVIEMGADVSALRGRMAYGRGRAKVIRVEGDRFLAQIEKSCGPIRIGNLLLPFEKKDVVLGRDLGFSGTLQGGEVLTGRLVFLADDHNQISAQGYALIDIGRERGIQTGQQLTVFGAPSRDKGARALGNAVVIHVGPATSTIKILSSKDIILLGDLVQIK
jgi:hypothetical protein